MWLDKTVSLKQFPWPYCILLISHLCTYHGCHFAIDVCVGLLGMSRILVYIWILQVRTYHESENLLLYECFWGDYHYKTWTFWRIKLNNIYVYCCCVTTEDMKAKKRTFFLRPSFIQTPVAEFKFNVWNH